jgi:hypothetical protein
VLNWDGKNVAGSINPGGSITLASVFLDVSNWTVRFEADSKDIGQIHITAEGSWRHQFVPSEDHRLVGPGTTRGDFRLTRD